MTIVELLKQMGDKELVISQSGESIDFRMMCQGAEMELGIVAIDTFPDPEEIVDEMLRDMIDELDEYQLTGERTYFIKTEPDQD